MEYETIGSLSEAVEKDFGKEALRLANKLVNQGADVATLFDFMKEITK